jgi:hypothetical protein
VSPHAVVADGGALCHSGNLMVATAAKVRTYFHVHVHTSMSISSNTDLTQILTQIILLICQRM